MLKSRVCVAVVAALFLGVFLGLTSFATAAEIKVGVMNVQKILTTSAAGKEAKGIFDAKMNELQTRFKAEEEALLEMQKDIEKKSTAWSEETKQEKVLEFQKKRRELKAKTEDARFELKSLQDKELAPILKALEEVVDTYASVNAYTLILDSKNQTIYFDQSIDISDKLIIELDAVMGK